MKVLSKSWTKSPCRLQKSSKKKPREIYSHTTTVPMSLAFAWLAGYWRELDRRRLKSQHTAEELLAANQLLEQRQQPYSYLVEVVRQRDAQIRALKEMIASLEDSVSSLIKEQAALQQVKNSMAADFERLLSSEEELAVMKEVLLSMH